jgi:hypothetical protein
MILSPNSQQRKGLLAFCQLSEQKLESLAQKWCDGGTGVILSPSELDRDATAILEDAIAARAIVGQLLSLHGFMRRSGHTAAEVTSGLTEGLKSIDDFPEVQVRVWQKREPTFTRLLEATAIRNAAAAAELRFDYANICDDIRIITDIRPIFSRDGLVAEGGVVSFTMRLEYTTEETSKQISIALDERDVVRLMETCRRSLLKAETSKALIESLNLPALISGANGGGGK